MLKPGAFLRGRFGSIWEKVLERLYFQGLFQCPSIVWGWISCAENIAGYSQIFQLSSISGGPAAAMILIGIGNRERGERNVFCNIVHNGGGFICAFLMRLLYRGHQTEVRKELAVCRSRNSCGPNVQYYLGNR